MLGGAEGGVDHWWCEEALNAVEGFFPKLARHRLRHGVFHSAGELQATINRLVREYKCRPPQAVRPESRSR